jgi:type III secretory pathway component EscT
MFQKVRMPNRQLFLIIAIIAAGSILTVISHYSESTNICPLRQLNLEAQIQKYDITKDPQTCDTLNTKISKFNSQCKSDVEELDCG